MLHCSRLLAVATASWMACAAHASATVDLGVASQFSAITFGNFSGEYGDTLSLLAVGGNATLSHWTVNDYGFAGYGSANQSLIVGGSLTASYGKVLGERIGVVNAQGTPYVRNTADIQPTFDSGAVSTGSPAPLNFEQLQMQLRGTSTDTAALAATGTVDYAGGSTELTGSNRDVEVFNLNGTELSLDSYMTALGGLKSGSTLIFNVSGTHVSMTNFGFGSSLEGHSILMNFYQAETLSFSGLAIEGAVLAPWADVTGSDGNIGGTFVANSFKSVNGGNFEFHDLSFSPVVVPTTPVPEPSTWLMMAAGIAGLAGARRRQRVFTARAST